MERLLKESAGFACLVQPCIPQRGGTVLSHAGSDPHAYVGRMRERFFVALAVTGGAYAIAFVNPSWVSSTKRSSSRQYGGAQTLALDIDSYMIPHPDKAATGDSVWGSQCSLASSVGVLHARFLFQNLLRHAMLEASPLPLHEGAIGSRW